MILIFSLFLLACAGIILRAWLVSCAKRRRLAAAYANLVVREAAEPLRRGQLVADAGGGRVRAAIPPPPVPYWNCRSQVMPIRRQPFQAERALVTSDEGPSLNLPLAELLVEVRAADESPTPAVDTAPFEGGGGGSGGAGASGGWDAPSGDTGSGVGSVD